MVSIAQYIYSRAAVCFILTIHFICQANSHIRTETLVTQWFHASFSCLDNVTTGYFSTPGNYSPVAMHMAYGQQPSPPVTTLSSNFQYGVPPASKGSDKVLMSVVFSMNIL